MKTRLSLFYLDDDLDDLLFFKNAAQELGHNVMTFTNGNDLLYALRQASKFPDMIFLDIHMPILNGEEMLNLIKKSDDYKHIPVIMISGAYPKKLIRQYTEVGANYLMKKPAGNLLKAELQKVLATDFGANGQKIAYPA